MAVFLSSRRPASGGFSMIEAMVALAIISIIVVILGSSVKAMRSLYRTSDWRARALGYTQEALDIVNKIKDTQFIGTGCTPRPGYTECWDSCPDLYGTCAGLQLVAPGSDWSLASGGPESITSDIVFTRAITLQDLCRDPDTGALNTPGCVIDTNSKKVTVTVAWDEQGITKSVALSEIFNHW